MHGVHPAPERLDAVGGLRRVAAVEERDVGSGLGERDRGALAEPAARPGDEGDSAVEAEGIENHGVLLSGTVAWSTDEASW